MIIPLVYSEKLIVIQEWEVVHEVNVSTMAIGNHLLMPKFSETFPFILDYGTGVFNRTEKRKKSNSFDLVNLNTGHRDTLIQGSAQNWGKFPASFFEPLCNDRFKLHFCTTRQNDDLKYEHAYHVMEFNQDVIHTLEKFGRLPIDSIEKQMQLIKQLEEQE